MPFKETDSVFSSEKNKYKDLKENYPHFFPKYSDIFNICAAIGIKESEEKEIKEKKLEVGKASIIDREGALYKLMKYKYPEMDDKERLNKLQKFAEYGIIKLYDKVTSMDTYNPDEF